MRQLLKIPPWGYIHETFCYRHSDHKSAFLSLMILPNCFPVKKDEIYSNDFFDETKVVYVTEDFHFSTVSQQLATKIRNFRSWKFGRLS